MLIYKAFRFRIYPTLVQRARLARWESVLRWLWNLANEQRLLGRARCKDDVVFVHYAAQNRELTALRKECPWLSDVPADLCQAVLKDLDTGWRRFYAGLGRRPRYKSRSKDHRAALRCEAPKRFRLDAAGVRQFPKLGRIKTVLHRAIEGVAKTCSLVREGTQWFVAVACQVDVAPPAPRLTPSIGIVPVKGSLYATSMGQLVALPPKVHRTRVLLKRARRTVDRRQNGSSRSERAHQRVIRLQYREQRQLAHAWHVNSKRIAENQGIAVIEQWVPGVSNPRPDWGTFGTLLKYKLTWSGGRLVEVCPPHRCGSGDDRTVSDSGVAAAIRILSAWESLAPARGRQPGHQARSKRESDANQGPDGPRRAHRASS